MPKTVGVLQFVSIITLIAACIAFAVAAFSETFDLGIGWGVSILFQGIVASSLLYGFADLLERSHLANENLAILVDHFVGAEEDDADDDQTSS